MILIQKMINLKFMVPVKWFKSYTIAIECDTQIEIMAGLYDSNKLINPFSNVDDFSLYDKTYFKNIWASI